MMLLEKERIKEDVESVENESENLRISEKN
jgi:hypothetical protein